MHITRTACSVLGLRQKYTGASPPNHGKATKVAVLPKSQVAVLLRKPRPSKTNDRSEQQGNKVATFHLKVINEAYDLSISSGWGSGRDPPVFPAAHGGAPPWLFCHLSFRPAMAHRGVVGRALLSTSAVGCDGFLFHFFVIFSRYFIGEVLIFLNGSLWAPEVRYLTHLAWRTSAPAWGPGTGLSQAGVASC